MSAPVALARPLPSSVNSLSDRKNIDPQELKAAEGMEALFLDFMMKAMRQTVPKNDMDLESSATQIYRGMLDSRYADTAAKQGGVGLADQIIAYLESQKYALKTGGQGIPPGGSHEGPSRGK